MAASRPWSSPSSARCTMHLGFVSLVGAAAGAAAARRGAPSPSSTRVPLPTGVAAATTLWPGRRHPRLVPLSPAAAAAAAVAAAAAAATTTPAPLAGRTATRHDRRGGGVPATAPPPPSSRPSPTTCSLHPLSHRTVAWLAPVLPHRAQWRLHRGTRAQRLDRLLMAVVGGVLTLLLPAPFGRYVCVWGGSPLCEAASWLPGSSTFPSFWPCCQLVLLSPVRSHVAAGFARP